MSEKKPKQEEPKTKEAKQDAPDQPENVAEKKMAMAIQLALQNLAVMSNQLNEIPVAGEKVKHMYEIMSGLGSTIAILQNYDNLEVPEEEKGQ